MSGITWAASGKAHDILVSGLDEVVVGSHAGRGEDFASKGI